ncbi:MAG: GNAT family N-acetyltransferase [Pseudomonadota bacterium]
MTPLASITTPRLLLRASDPDMAAAVAAFYRRNRTPHARWNPPLDESMFSVDGQAARLAESAAAAAAGTGIGWWLFAPDAPDVALGQIHFSQLVRRAFCNAMLGYAIDAGHEGRGLMREALEAALSDAFGPRVQLHRVQANVRPENTRSLALLARLAFEREGLAREYLFIDGAWRDHVMTARRHPSWPADAAPSV